MRRGGTDSDRLSRFGLLASAIAGRALQVAPAQPGDPAWTDGRTVFLDAGASPREQVGALAVQASLLAAGSLEADLVRRLAGRTTRAKRYLALEGHRALAANEGALPGTARSLLDRDIAARTDSPTASLAAALSREPIAAPPASFGAIRARRLLASREPPAIPTPTAERVPSERRDLVRIELEEDEGDTGTAGDLFSSPGAGGAAGRFLQRMLRMVRRLGGGPPGLDAPSHQTRPRRRSGSSASVATRMAPRGMAETRIEGRGTTYPEWDFQRRGYRWDWCAVQEVEPRTADGTSLVASDRYGLRRPLARLGVGLDRCHRQVQGDDLDIDAVVEARVAALAGSAPDEAVYVDSLRCRRDLAVLLLLDISGSVAEQGISGQAVHEQQRAVAAALTVALHDLGDRVALYAFHSRGRSAVHLLPVKRFDEALDARVMRRLHGLVPGAYSRLGAAIRHGAALLEERAGTSRRLLVVLSDGLAYDHGYERLYGAADARHALAEARRGGNGCLCLTVGAGTDAEDLRRVFGSAAHATVPRPEMLRRVIGPLFRSALAAAEVRRQRRVASREGPGSGR